MVSTCSNMVLKAVSNILIVIAALCALATMDLAAKLTIDATLVGLVAHSNEQSPARRLSWSNKSTPAEEAAGLNTTWTKFEVGATFSLPASVDSGYSSICDPHSDGFMMNNDQKSTPGEPSAIERAHVNKYHVASFIGMMKVGWMVFKLSLPWLFPPKFPVAVKGRWRLKGDCEPYSAVMAWKAKNDGPFCSLEDDAPAPSNDFQECFPQWKLGWDENLKGWNKDGLEKEWGNADAEFYDPKDYHHTTRLDEIIPSSNNFNPKKAMHYFEVRLQEPATKWGLSLPWSQRTQVLVFFAQCIHGVVAIFKSLIWGRPHFWMFYTPDWFCLTFRPELLLGRMYTYYLGYTLRTNLEHFSEVASTALLFVFEGAFWIFSIPFAPAICCGVWLPIFYVTRIFLYVNDDPLGYLWLACCSLPALAWPFLLGWLSKRLFSASRDTYLCPMSHMSIVTWEPESVSSFFITTAIITCGLMMLMAVVSCFLCSAYGFKLLSAEYMLNQWLKESFDGDDEGYTAQKEQLEAKLEKYQDDVESRKKHRAEQLSIRQRHCVQCEIKEFDPCKDGTWHCAGCYKLGGKEQKKPWVNWMKQQTGFTNLATAAKHYACENCKGKRFCSTCSKVLLAAKKHLESEAGQQSADMPMSSGAEGLEEPLMEKG